MTERRPWVALLLSLLQPGLGQVYAGKLRRGLGIFAAMLGLTVLLFALVLLRLGPLVVAAMACAAAVWVAVQVDAVVQARRAARPYVLQPWNRWYYYLAAIIVLNVVGLFRPDVIHAFRSPSGSMAPTLLVGDWFYADKRASTLRSLGRSDLVLYQSPDDGLTVMKRIVGVAGDTLQIRRDTLFRNGVAVVEPYVDRTLLTRDTGMEGGTWGPLVVPRDSVFVLGDNRHASKDSRHVGAIAVASFIGTPTVVYYSYDPEGDAAAPFITAIRWSRLGATPR